MSDSGDGQRNKVVTAGFCVLAVLGALVLLYVVGLLNGAQSERRQNYPHAHSETAKQKAESACVGTEPNAVFECVVGYVGASEETAYTEQDLTAQQRAAWGALIAALAGVVSIFVSLLGLFWIKGTLDATQVTANAMLKQNELAEFAQRPWLVVEYFKIVSVSYLDTLNGVGEKITYLGEVSIKNIGSTVAQDFVEICVLDISKNQIWGKFLEIIDKYGGSQSPFYTDCLAPGEVKKIAVVREFDAAVLPSNQITLALSVSYRDDFGRFHTTIQDWYVDALSFNKHSLQNVGIIPPPGTTKFRTVRMT